MDQEIDSGGGLVVGRNANAGGDFAGRDQSGNTVNVNFPDTWNPQASWNPSQSHGQDRGLSVSAEESLRADIRELRTVLNDLSRTVGGLDKTLALEVAGAKERLDLMQRLIDQLARERDEGRPMFDQRTSAMLIVIGFLILLFLGIMAWGTLFG